MSLAPKLTRARLLCPLVFLLLGLTGCLHEPRTLRAPDRYPHGIAYVLPGIEGRSIFNYNIAVGLDKGGFEGAVEVYDWTTGIPGGELINLTYLERNRREAARLARKIIAFRDRNPGAPVYLVGHSGGGGVVVLVLEALPRNYEVEVAVLLAPALTPDYDLSGALKKTRGGIYNFYSNLDVGLLGVGTSVFGAIDRGHGPSAGAIGFDVPGYGKRREAYLDKLHQVRWVPEMMKVGAVGDHFGWATQTFSQDFLAPLLRTGELPPLPSGTRLASEEELAADRRDSQSASQPQRPLRAGERDAEHEDERGKVDTQRPY